MKILTTFDDQKTILQAFLFILLWGILVLAVLICTDMFMAYIPTTYRYMFGRIVATVVPFFISLSIVQKKKLNNEPMNLLLVFASLVLGWMAGIFIGLLPTAYLTTLPKKK